MFPNNSPFTRSEDEEDYLRRVRESALAPPQAGDDHGVADAIRQEAEEVLERYEHDFEQLRNKMDK
jgi:hypothetical protein